MTKYTIFRNPIIGATVKICILNTKLVFIRIEYKYLILLKHTIRSYCHKFLIYYYSLNTFHRNRPNICICKWNRKIILSWTVFQHKAKKRHTKKGQLQTMAWLIITSNYRLFLITYINTLICCILNQNHKASLEI